LQKIEEYIDLSDQTRDVVDVDVVTGSGEMIIVITYTYVWSGALAALEGKGWDLVEYTKGGVRTESSQVTRSGSEVVGLRVARKTWTVGPK